MRIRTQRRKSALCLVQNAPERHRDCRVWRWAATQYWINGPNLTVSRQQPPCNKVQCDRLSFNTFSQAFQLHCINLVFSFLVCSLIHQVYDLLIYFWTTCTLVTFQNPLFKNVLGIFISLLEPLLSSDSLSRNLFSAVLALRDWFQYPDSPFGIYQLPQRAIIPGE